MMRPAIRLISTAGLVLFLAAPAFAQIASSVVVSGLTSPVAIVVDPLDAATFFVVEQRGVVQVIRNGQIQPTPFLDLRDAVVSGGEQGMLGIAIEPGGTRVFINFTNRDGDTVIARFRRSADDPRMADPSSRRDLIWPDGRAFVDQPFSNHNGGHLLFGPDGFLYVGLGDGGSGGDPMHFAQDPRSLLGKMLRLDVGVPDDDPRGYRVPADNPFVDGDPVPALPEIWAFGLRNPWRYSFDDPHRGGTGALLIGDVGQGAREEVDYEPPNTGGRNYGWRLREGTAAYDDRRPAAFGPLVDPIQEYRRDVGQSITGGFVYRGSALDPSFIGRYFYADFVSGRVFSVALDQTAPATPTAADQREHTEALSGRSRVGLLSSFGVDAEGELYLLDYEAGSLLKIVPDASSVPGIPRILGMATEAERITVRWGAADGMAPRSYLVETTAEAGGRTMRTIETAAEEITVTLAAEKSCLRVRAHGRGGAGPATKAICVARYP